MTTRYLSVDDVVRLNARHGGPSAGLADFGVLEGAVARAAAGVHDEEFYPSLWDKAGVLLHGLARTQAFVDGNKRTAWVAALTFLEVNGTPLRLVHDKVAAAFVLAVAAGLLEVEEVTEVLRDGIGTDWAKDEAEKAGWVNEDNVTAVLDYETYAGSLSLGLTTGVSKLDLGYVKFSTIEPGQIPWGSDDIRATRRYTFAATPDLLRAFVRDLQQMLRRIGTPAALPGTPTNDEARTRPGPRRGTQGSSKRKKKKGKRRPR